MSVIFEFKAGKDFHFSQAFAERFGIQVVDERVYLPKELGTGFIQEVYLTNGLSLCLHDYCLNEELILRRCDSATATMLTIKFDRSDISGKTLFSTHLGLDVELGTGNFFYELVLPARQAVSFLVIVASRQVLLELAQFSTGNYLAEMLGNNESFLLHESMNAEMERILKQLTLINDQTLMAQLLYKTKAQELVYLLFCKLLARKGTTTVTINPEDAEKIYQVRLAIIADLSKAPLLPRLAEVTGISLTKMKELFRQIFGDSIYNYYQSARMAQAAELLNFYSVSEVGYKVGFTNLSHFSRLFEKHHHIKPKKYKDALQSSR